jgi:hypothetical protein
MSFSAVVFIAAAATVVNADYTNTWWTPSSLLPSSTSVWTPSSVAAEPVWTPSSESVWTPSTSAESVWAPSSTRPKGNVSISTSYTNTVYVTKATTATTTVDCGKGTMIYGNGSAPVHTPKVGLPSGMPTDLPSEWSTSIPASVFPPQLSASGGVMTTNCANASITYTITYTPSSGKPKMTSSSIEAPAEPTDQSFPTLPPSGEDGHDFPAPGPHSDDDDDESSDSSSSGSSKPSGGFSNGDDMDMDSAATRQDVSAAGTILALGVVAIAAFML